MSRSGRRGSDKTAPAHIRSSASSSSSSRDRYHRIEIPTHMRYHFLHETSHLPAKVFHHLESYIKPTASRPACDPPKKLPGKRHLNTKPRSTLPNSASMNLDPDLYIGAERQQQNQEPDDPQRESSSAATSRAQSKKHDLSSSSNSRYSADLAQSSPNTEVDNGAESIHADSVYKANPTTAVCKLNEMTFSSQWTRPATELLREILEVRYPAVVEEYEAGVEDEQRPLLGADLSRMDRKLKLGRCDGWLSIFTGVFSRN